MTKFLENTFVNVLLTTGIIFMLSVIVCIVYLMCSYVKEWIDDWRKENEAIRKEHTNKALRGWKANENRKT